MDWSAFVTIAFVILWGVMPLLAGLIAWRKGRFWIAAVLVAVVAPPLGVALACFQSVAPGLARRQAPTWAKLLLGLLPLWVGVVVMVVGSITTDSPGYWQSAPWITVITLPACSFTLVLVEVFAGVLRPESA